MNDHEKAGVTSSDQNTSQPRSPRLGLPPLSNTTVSQKATGTGRSLSEFVKLPVDSPLHDRYAQLEAKSRGGDSDAALQLYLDLNECSFLTSAAAAKAVAADSSYAGMTDQQRASAVADDNGTLDRIEKAKKNCVDITDAQVKTARAQLQRAADLGNPYAQLLYPSRGAPGDWDPTEMLKHADELADFNDRSLAYVQSAAQRCIPEAIGSLSDMYEEDGAHPNSQLAYAYYLVAVLNAGGVDGNPAVSSQLAEKLDESQRSAAAEYANKFVTTYCH